jgi:hypothetical protein
LHTQCIPEQLEFQGLGTRRVVADFSGGRIRLDGTCLDAGPGGRRQIRTNGLRVHRERYAGSAFQHRPSPILAHLKWAKPSGAGQLVPGSQARNPTSRMTATTMQQCGTWNPSWSAIRVRIEARWTDQRKAFEPGRKGGTGQSRVLLDATGQLMEGPMG